MRRTLLSGLLLAGLLTALALPHATADFTQPDAYAVIIGISQYREEVIPKVAYAVKDAEAVANLLETQAGIPKSHIRLLTDAKATGNDLRTVGEWLRMRVKPESTVYVYYAGHGTPDQKTGDAYLVPWDGHPDFPQGLYPLKDLYAALNALPLKNIIVLLDSCFSGAAGRSVLAKGARPMALTVENPVLASGKLVVLAASTGTQISSDYDKERHGLFTYALLTGLHGAADKNHDGTVTLKELYPYVRDRVAQTALDELNREQTPVLFPSLDFLGQRASLPLWKLHQPAKPLPRRNSKMLEAVLSLVGLGKRSVEEFKPVQVFEISNLHGSVRRVVEEMAEITDRNGTRVQGKRTPIQEWVFDRRGNVVQKEDYVLHNTFLLAYDDHDNVVKIDSAFCKSLFDGNSPDLGRRTTTYTITITDPQTGQVRRATLDSPTPLSERQVQQLRAAIGAKHALSADAVMIAPQPAAPPVGPPSPPGPCSSREREVYLFDGKGNLTEKTYVKADGSLKGKTTWSYDPEGKIAERVEYDHAGSVISKELHVYSVHGTVMTETISHARRGPEGDLILSAPDEWVRHEFDEKGHKISEDHTAINQDPWSESDVQLLRELFIEEGKEKELDQLLKKRKELYTPTPVPISKVLYSYDLMGNLVQREHIFWMGPGEGSIFEKKVYDGADRKIEEIRYKEDGSISEHFRNNYRTDGQIDQTIIFAADGSVQDRHVYSYNASGLLMKMESARGVRGRFAYDKYANPTQWEMEDSAFEFDYQSDAHGNWIRLEMIEWVKEGGRLVYKSGNVRYRTITYD